VSGAAASVVDALAAVAESDPAPLDVAADLTVETDGREVRIDSFTDQVMVELPSMGVALSLLRQAGVRRGTLAGVAGVLAAADLTARVRIRGTEAAVVGADAAPGRTGRRLSPHVEIRPGGAALAALGEISGAL
jgi:hypothetical protein